MKSAMQSRLLFVGRNETSLNKRLKKPAAKEIDKTIYYDYVKTEVSYV